MPWGVTPRRPSFALPANKCATWKSLCRRSSSQREQKRSKTRRRRILCAHPKKWKWWSKDSKLKWQRSKISSFRLAWRHKHPIGLLNRVVSKNLMQRLMRKNLLSKLQIWVNQPTIRPWSPLRVKIRKIRLIWAKPKVKVPWAHTTALKLKSRMRIAMKCRLIRSWTIPIWILSLKRRQKVARQSEISSLLPKTWAPKSYSPHLQQLHQQALLQVQQTTVKWLLE